MKNGVTKSRKIGQWPSFVEESDLEEAREIEIALDKFTRHWRAFHARVNKEDFNRALNAYSQDPTDANLKTLMQTSVAATLSDGGFQRTARTAVREALRNTFVRPRFVPWAQKIVNRALVQARAAYDEVAAEEKERYKDLTGEDLGTQVSPLIAKAESPITELQAILLSIDAADEIIGDRSMRRFLEILRECANKRP